MKQLNTINANIVLCVLVTQLVMQSDLVNDFGIRLKFRCRIRWCFILQWLRALLNRKTFLEGSVSLMNTEMQRINSYTL